jgi:hypothetical protein
MFSEASDELKDAGISFFSNGILDEIGLSLSDEFGIKNADLPAIIGLIPNYRFKYTDDIDNISTENIVNFVNLF